VGNFGILGMGWDGMFDMGHETFVDYGQLSTPSGFQNCISIWAIQETSIASVPSNPSKHILESVCKGATRSIDHAKGNDTVIDSAYATHPEIRLSTQCEIRPITKPYFRTNQTNKNAP
jgi:hypothetical protein